MNIADTEALLSERGAAAEGLLAEVGTAGRAPHDYAYLKLTTPSDTERYAIVSTPGNRWFELEVTGGYNTGRTDDLASDETVREYVEQFLRAAIAYLNGRSSIRKSGIFRVPILTIETDGRPINLAPRARGATNRF